jgi:predicted RNA-binding protein YlxR (DUF448 family)
MEPVRTCVGCRQRASRTSLIRIVNQSSKGISALIVDEKAILPGRGAWLHASVQCLKLAIERRAFGRALKLSATPDSSGLNSHIEQAETTLAKNE